VAIPQPYDHKINQDVDSGEPDVRDYIQQIGLFFKVKDGLISEVRVIFDTRQIFESKSSS
jgi:hypothetical protein